MIDEYRELWIKVIRQALSDLELMPCDVENEIAIHSARLWLSKPSEDLREVCDYAGVDMWKVLRYGRWKISSKQL